MHCMIKTLAAFLLTVAPGFAFAQTAETPRQITFAYTTDMHDHLLPGPGGVGGFASVATFLDTLRAQDKDLIVVDSGDATEKGDLAAFVRKGALIYDLMRDAGYSAATVGNHEENFGMKRVAEFAPHSGGILSAANLRDPEGNLLIQPFRIVGKPGHRVGIIGAALTHEDGPGPRGQSTAYDIDGTAQIIRDYASLLRNRHNVDMVVVITHAGLDDVRKLMAVEPDVDVVFAGHSHRVIEVPVSVNKRGTLVVQGGALANYIGVLKATYNDGRWAVANQVVPLEHAKFPPKAAVMDAIRAVHTELGYDPMIVVGTADKTLGSHSIARLAAEALRDHYRVDVAFIHPGWIVRNIIPEGPLTTNDIFKAMSDRAEALVRFELTGAQISHYFNELANKPEGGGGGGWGQSLAAGFKITGVTSQGARKLIKTDLAPERRYSVVMTHREWVWRFARMLNDESKPLPDIKTVEGGTFKPLADYIGKTNATRPLSKEAARLASLYGRAEPDEARREQRFIASQLIAEAEGE